MRGEHLARGGGHVPSKWRDLEWLVRREASARREWQWTATHSDGVGEREAELAGYHTGGRCTSVPGIEGDCPPDDRCGLSELPQHGPSGECHGRGRYVPGP